MQLDKQCLRCSKTTELNTMMKISVDEKSFDVALCDVHAEDTTPKKAQDLVRTKLKEFDDLVVKMRGYGIDITKNNMSTGGIAIPEKIEQVVVPRADQSTGVIVERAPVAQQIAVNQPTGVQVQYQRPEAVAPVIVGGKIMKEGGGRSLSFKPFSGVAHDTHGPGSVQLPGHASMNVGEAVEREMEAGKKSGTVAQNAHRPTSRIEATQIVKGRGGRAMTLPRVIRHSSGGDTIINVVDTGGDRTIQERTRALAMDKVVYNYGEKGYDVQTCPLCEGHGRTAINGQTCRKCDGMGILNRGWNG